MTPTNKIRPESQASLIRKDLISVPKSSMRVPLNLTYEVTTKLSHTQHELCDKCYIPLRFSVSEFLLPRERPAFFPPVGI